jgi:hypothetical protein
MKKAFSKRTGIFSAALLVLCLAGCNQGDKTADFTRRKAVDKVLTNDVPFRDFNVNTAKAIRSSSRKERKLLFRPEFLWTKTEKR